ncbi:DUF4307 domain-containing protein [Actinomadura macrotermitis]|uniref:DUF4307 domain-containing protein n=1 Tax=Actinomadura macrotermitis TaxID=2585200 RepID=A0A7K0BTB4_9ACTN|nr:DUF4307 domain-containing protein [Actinomadura macrotermitis]MQY03934.1 hypothetical protein [Actinomadura macrotermitis]
MTTTAPQDTTSVDERRGLGVLGWVVCGGLAAVFAVGWALIFAHVGQTPGISSQTYTWNVRGDNAVEVSYMVAKPKNDEVRCTVDAYDTHLAVLAEQQVVIPRGTARLDRTDTLTTPRRATGARVRDCRKV